MAIDPDDYADVPAAAYGLSPLGAPVTLPTYHYDHPYRALLRGRPDGMTLPEYIEALRAALADVIRRVDGE